MKVKFKDGGNTKLGNMGVWSSLMGDENYYIPELDCFVRGTCGNHCKGCKGKCYVRKSYIRWTNEETGKCSVKLGHARNTIAMREDINKCFEDLNEQLTRKRVPFEMVRINQSGEFENEEQFDMFCTISAMHHETEFYAYTKAVEIVVPALLAGKVPENFTILISIWHEYGIEEYKKVAHLPNVKAFVYVDYNSDKENGWTLEDYAKHGINITTMCMAYDERGKMNHNITCDKCKKCFNRFESCKVVGCLSH